MSQENPLPPLLAQIRDWLAYEPDTGLFRYRITRGKSKAGRVAGFTNTRGYVMVRAAGKVYRGHRVAWLCVYGCWPSGEIDHINGVKDDNRIANLRDATKSVNNQNKIEASSHSSTGLRGTWWSNHAKKWRSTIYVNGRAKQLGCFETAEAAHEAYVAAKHKLHPAWERARSLINPNQATG